jgi:hypothetical protein
MARSYSEGGPARACANPAERQADLADHAVVDAERLRHRGQANSYNSRSRTLRYSALGARRTCEPPCPEAGSETVTLDARRMPVRGSLAAAGGGDLAMRMPERGVGEIAALERSFSPMAGSLGLAARAGQGALTAAATATFCRPCAGDCQARAASCLVRRPLLA